MGILPTKADENLSRNQGSRRERSRIAQGKRSAALGSQPIQT